MGQRGIARQDVPVGFGRRRSSDQEGAAYFSPAEGAECSLEVSRGEASLCLLLNRRARSMRVVDFRAGSQEHKLELILEVAKEEGIERAFTVVERDEANTWLNLGFKREGSLPGFYKRSDAYLLGMETRVLEARESATRIRVGGASTTSAPDRAERAFRLAERLSSLRPPLSLSKVKVASPRPKEREKAWLHAHATGRAITHFESFGRDAEKREVLCTSRGGFSLLIAVEEQPCFDNVFLDLLCAPRGEKEAWLVAAALEHLCQELALQEKTAFFAISPGDAPELSAAWLAAGFQRTGRLRAHLRRDGRRVDAFLWSRRICLSS